MREFEEKQVPRGLKLGLSLISVLLIVGGLGVGLLLEEVAIGVLLFALGGIAFALRGYLNTGDKVVTGALIFVAATAIGIQAIVYFLGP